jgi:hypothetical protein
VTTSIGFEGNVSCAPAPEWAASASAAAAVAFSANNDMDLCIILFPSQLLRSERPSTRS